MNTHLVIIFFREKDKENNLDYGKCNKNNKLFDTNKIRMFF